MSSLLLHTPDYDLSPIADALASEQIETAAVHSADDLTADERPTVLILDATARNLYSQASIRALVDAGGSMIGIGSEGEEAVPDLVPEQLLSAFLVPPFGAKQLLVALRTAFRDAATRMDNKRLRVESAARTREMDELTRIGVALGTERDLDTLLDMILSQARRITMSDAGSLYLVEKVEGDSPTLRFKLAHTYSRPDMPLVEFTMPINHKSIAGYVAATGQPLVIDDAYFLPPDVEYTFNRSNDEKHDYRTRSMLTIPMVNHKDEVIGVLQLINRKRDLDAKLETKQDFDTQVTPYSPRTVELVSGLAGQAAVSIENSQLYKSIERLFEGFVTAAVTAIEQRDPTTFGHSGRVATMTVAIAKATDRTGEGKYRDLTFSREQIRVIRYAALLHDFGKVGVREQVLVKAKKLYPPDLALIKQRYAFIRRTSEGIFYRQRAEYLEQHGQQGYDAFLAKLTLEHDENMKSLDRFLSLVMKSNEPTVLPEGSFADLLRYAEESYPDIDGTDLPFLTEDEARFLTIRKGSLDESERLEIESHVNHTYRFLQQIPWTEELQAIPTIAWGHHEKLDGRGYPRGVRGDDIPVQTRMMTITDIFDALTASDRPYKRAVPIESALNIMSSEVEGGMLDTELFQIFHEAKVYESLED
ncbi:MAG: GAF domain-containing protein [Gemmatimonadetes bacterium]|nr:GAF domain-containing protein [Gemmatimonadota bacterium]